MDEKAVRGPVHSDRAVIGGASLVASWRARRIHSSSSRRSLSLYTNFAEARHHPDSHQTRQYAPPPVRCPRRPSAVVLEPRAAPPLSAHRFGPILDRSPVHVGASLQLRGESRRGEPGASDRARGVQTGLTFPPFVASRPSRSAATTRSLRGHLASRRQPSRSQMALRASLRKLPA